MKYCYSLLFALIMFPLNAQEIEFFGGATLTEFFDYETENPSNRKNYSANSGFHLGLAFDHIKIDSQDFRFSILLEQYGGNIQARSGGLGGGVNTTAQIKKILLSIAIYPFNKKLYKNLKFGLGIRFSGLIDESFSGTMFGYAGSDPALSPKIDLTEKFEQYNLSFYLNLVGYLSYDFKINERYFLSPRYSIPLWTYQ